MPTGRPDVLEDGREVTVVRPVREEGDHDHRGDGEDDRRNNLVNRQVICRPKTAPTKPKTTAASAPSVVVPLLRGQREEHHPRHRAGGVQRHERPAVLGGVPDAADDRQRPQEGCEQ